jgi:hypothetical protein
MFISIAGKTSVLGRSNNIVDFIMMGKEQVWYLPVSVEDPDPHECAFILVGWIRIRTGNTDPDLGGPK